MLLGIKPIRRLWGHLSPARHRQMTGLSILMVFASASEVISLGAVLPFLSVLTSPEKLFARPEIQPLLARFDLRTPESLLLPVTIAFIAAVFFSGITRLLLIWFSTRISFAIGNDISSAIYEKTLYQPFIVHVSRNSSEVVTGIMIKAKRITGLVVMPVLNIMSSALIAISIIFYLVQLSPFVLGTAMFFFAAIYAAMGMAVKNQLRRNGEIEAQEQNNTIRTLQEGLGGIRDVLLSGNQHFYSTLFYASDNRLRNAMAITHFTGASPKYFFETLGMILIALLAYYVYFTGSGIISALPLLGSLALASQRLLPILHQAYQGWANYKSIQPTLTEILDLLDQPIPAGSDQRLPPLGFERHLELENLEFRFSKDGPEILSEINLKIEKGMKIGFIGTTGSGKSTLLDLTMGLLTPTGGRLRVDGQDITSDNVRRWQALIANVPQSIFLADTTLAENIAFGITADKIDQNLLVRSAQGAQILDFIESLPQKFATRTGERGVRLSGGQRQRIGIARALYRQASVLVFDEATSALDNETEKAVMDAIHNLGRDITILIVAHRISTLVDCDLIVELENGRIKRQGSFTEICGSLAAGGGIHAN